MGRALFADGLGTALSSAIGGSPTTTYAENIGVMAATRVYSTAAYYVAAVVAILLGLVPKFGAVVSATPGGVLGGITVVLYGMIGLLGAKIWIENKVNFANPVNLVPIAAGIIIGVGGVAMTFGDNFVLSGISLGSIVAIVAYHVARLLAPKELREPLIEDREYVQERELRQWSGGLGRVAGAFSAVWPGSDWMTSASASSMRCNASAGICTPAAFTFACTCSGRDAPMIAAATLSFCSTQAMANWAMVIPSSSATGSPSAGASTSSLIQRLIMFAPPLSSVAIREPSAPPTGPVSCRSARPARPGTRRSG